MMIDSLIKLAPGMRSHDSCIVLLLFWSDSCMIWSVIHRALVAFVTVCRDLTARRSLGYGYVNYSNPPDAARAWMF